MDLWNTLGSITVINKKTKEAYAMVVKVDNVCRIVTMIRAAVLSRVLA